MVCLHPFIIGELACGNIQNRQEVLNLLQNLSTLPIASDKEVLLLIEGQSLMGKGISYVDAHLLASVLLSQTTKLWTRDKRLRAIATEMNLNYATL